MKATQVSIPDRVADYANKTVDLLFELLLDVLKNRQADIIPVLKGEREVTAKNKNFSSVYYRHKVSGSSC